MCSLLLKPLLWILFFDCSKNKQISIHLFSCLPYVVKIKSCVKNILLHKICTTKKLTKTKFFSFRKNLPFFSILFHSRKNFCEQTPVLSVLSLCISLSLFKKLFRIFKMNLFRFFCVFLSYKFFFRPFFITSCFCSSRFAFTSFFISFSFDLFFFFISFFLNSFFFTTFTFFNLFEQQVTFLFVSKTLQLFTFYMHALPLFVLLFIDLFICCLFFLFFFSLSMTSF